MDKITDSIMKGKTVIILIAENPPYGQDLKLTSRSEGCKWINIKIFTISGLLQM